MLYTGYYVTNNYYKKKLYFRLFICIFVPIHILLWKKYLLLPTYYHVLTNYLQNIITVETIIIRGLFNISWFVVGEVSFLES